MYGGYVTSMPASTLPSSMRCACGELVVLPGGFDVVEGAEERAVGVDGGSAAEAVGDGGDVDGGVGGVQVGEVDAGQLSPVERARRLRRGRGPRRRGRTSAARAACRRASAAAKSAIASGSLGEVAAPQAATTVAHLAGDLVEGAAGDAERARPPASAG